MAPSTSPQTTNRYADVIVPLNVEGYFTYRIPSELLGSVLPGQLVIVQFGQKRFYAGLVRQLHNEEPVTYAAKTIQSIHEQEPIVTEQEFQLWEWMAEYYITTVGEVMHAALPSAFRFGSETKVLLKAFDEEPQNYTDDEYIIAEALSTAGELSIKELQELLGKKTVYPILRSLMYKGVAAVKEEMQGSYSPRYETHLKLADSIPQDEQSLQQQIDGLANAPKQQRLFQAFLNKRQWQRQQQQGQPLIHKVKLQKETGVDAATVRKVIDKGLLEEVEVEVGRLHEYTGEKLTSPTLTERQHEAFQAIRQHYHEKDIVLLHGVTSSGKTEIYIKLIEEAIQNGGRALYLLPEISLTGQIIERLRKVFGDKVGIYHSKFSHNEQAEIWQKVRKGEYDVVIGPRSAVFLPVPDLSLIIVDEEHDTSYKQFDPSPRYQARDTAIYRGIKAGAKVMLGTATPSLESYYNAQRWKYGLVSLTERYGGMDMPEVDIVDLRDEVRKNKMKTHFSSVLLDHLVAALDNGEQVILFQNRRGFSPFVMCDECGWIPYCTNCDVSLTYHKFSNDLRCHLCGYRKSMIKECGNCQSTALSVKGFGTEKIEDEIKLLYPKARVQRMDQDTVRTKEGHLKLISKFEQGEIDILVGTQMVTKGLDFDNVSLIGVLSADQLLNYPDFRANERAFQLMAQVSGRSGRKYRKGKVIIQAYSNDHPVLMDVKHHDMKAFYEKELMQRQEFHYPPYYRLIHITIKHRKVAEVEKGARKFADALKTQLGSRVLGPSLPGVSKIRNYYLRDILLKIEKNQTRLRTAKQLIDQQIKTFKQDTTLRSLVFQVNVDP